MESRYVDTSVLIAYYCPEALSAEAEQRIRALKAVFVSQLTDVEIASAVSRKYRMGELTESSAREVLQMYSQQRAAHCFQITPLGPAEYQHAQQWIGTLTTPLRTLDALHLASANSMNLAVLTADTNMHQSANLLNIKSTLIVSHAG